MANVTDFPSYLNDNFFKTALENGLKTSGIEIKSIDMAMGSSVGDNYCSNIYRAKISYIQNQSALENISVIVKSIPCDKAKQVVFETNAPEKEMYFYQNLASKFEALLPGAKIAPKCFYATKEPLYTFVFEDLRAEGFTLGKRQRGLNESECKIVLELVGKYHAASMMLLEQEPEIFTNPIFKYGIFNPVAINNKVLQAFFFDSLEAEVDIVRNWAGFEKCADKMKNIHSNVKDRLLEVVKLNGDELKVLAHGDLWVNNFMLKYSSEDELEATEIRFLDFQEFYVISPGIDLNYFFNTSVQYEVLVNKRDYLVEHYYESLCSALLNFNYKDIPSLDVIKREIRRKEFYGFITAVAVLPIISLDASDSTDCNFELFSQKDAAERKRQLAYKSVRFEQTMKYVLKRADELGVLD